MPSPIALGSLLYVQPLSDTVYARTPRPRLARLEHLMSRRPELLSSVILRQNPHNVAEWHKRVKLFEGKPTKQILTYTEAVSITAHVQMLVADASVGLVRHLCPGLCCAACPAGSRMLQRPPCSMPALPPTQHAPTSARGAQDTVVHFLPREFTVTHLFPSLDPQVRTVDPDKAIGKPHSLWCAFAKFYERHGDVPNARIIFQKATEVGRPTQQALLLYQHTVPQEVERHVAS